MGGINYKPSKNGWFIIAIPCYTHIIDYTFTALAHGSTLPEPGSPDFRPNFLPHSFHRLAETLRAVCLHAALRLSMRHQAQETGKTPGRVAGGSENDESH